jgi:hypothetical protein
MAASATAKAERREADVYLAAIRDALADGDVRAALHKAVAFLESEAAKMRNRRPADASLTHAALAGSLAATASLMHKHKPPRPAGCPRIPGSDHLLAVFESARVAALGEGDPDA